MWHLNGMGNLRNVLQNNVEGKKQNKNMFALTLTTSSDEDYNTKCQVRFS